MQYYCGLASIALGLLLLGACLGVMLTRETFGGRSRDVRGASRGRSPGASKRPAPTPTAAPTKKPPRPRRTTKAPAAATPTPTTAPALHADTLPFGTRAANPSPRPDDPTR